MDYALSFSLKRPQRLMKNAPTDKLAGDFSYNSFLAYKMTYKRGGFSSPDRVDVGNT